MAVGDRYKAFMQGVLSKITDPGQRTEAQATMDAVLANPTLAAAMDDGVAGQSEIDRQLQELRNKTAAADQLKTDLDEREGKLQTWHTNLTKWRGDNQELVEMGVAAKKAGWKPGDPPPKTGGNGNGDPTPEDVVTVKDLQKTLGEMEASYLGYDAEKTLLMKNHHDLFGSFLDITPLIKHPQMRELGLVGVYNLVHKEALDAKAKERQAAHDKKIADEAVAKFRAEQSTQLPYPLTPQGPGSGSPLDGLNAKVDPAAGSLVDRASLEYQRLQTGRTAPV